MDASIIELERGAKEARETHISRVFLNDHDVFKLKKPIAPGFLDFTTAEKRRAACEAEVRLGRRLAPDVYLGVLPIRRDGEVVDWAVHMRRLRDEDSAEARLARGALGIAEIDRIAERIARFHDEAEVGQHISKYGAPEAIAFNVRENFEQTRERGLDAILAPREAEEIEARQLGFLRDRRDVLLARIEQGRVRDGHGDLRLEHVYLEGDRILVIDCIEFNERFRYADVAADLAFLSMDLAWHRRSDLAERFLATYARETSDFDLYRVVDFYESYRAYVRGKIATMIATDRAGDERLRAQARRYFLLALAAARQPLLPSCVIAIGGVLATGKSTLADRLGAILGAPSINTDRVRKHMLGARPTEKLYEGSWSGAYDPRTTERVYARVNDGARAVVGSGRPVILDASFRTRSMRESAKRLAAELGVPFVLVECRADPEVCRERLRQRAREESVSDGRLEIFDDFLRSWEPVNELRRDEHVILDTARPIEASLAELRDRVPSWPDGLTG